MLFKRLQSDADAARAACREACQGASAAAERLSRACAGNNGVEYLTPEGDRVKKADFSHINGRETLNPR